MEEKPRQRTDAVELHTNQEYIDEAHKWKMYQDFYDNDAETIRSEYLVRHDLETKRDGAKKYAGRRLRTFPQNFADPVVSIWQDLFMKGEPIIPKEVDDLFNGYETDVDGNKNSLLTYLETEMLRDRFVQGNPTTLVDAPRNTAVNVQEERASGIRPFVVPIRRLALVDWAIERRNPIRAGLYNFVSFQYPAHEPRETFYDKDSIKWYRRVVWRTEKPGQKAEVYSQIFSGDAPGSKEWYPESPPERIQGFTEVPCITMLGAESWIHDLTIQAQKYLNLESMLDNILYYQGYRHTYIIGDVPAEDRNKVSEYVNVILPPGSTVTALTSENPLALLQRLDDTENRIWRFALQQIRQVPTNSKVGQSADAQRMERDPTLNMVKRNIKQFTEFSNHIIKLVAEYNNKPDFQAKLAFSREITSADVEQTVLVMNAVKQDLSRLPTLRKEILKQLVQACNFPPEPQQKIVEEIDAIPDEEVSDTRFNSTMRAVFENGATAAEKRPKGAPTSTNNASDEAETRSPNQLPAGAFVNGV